MKTALIIALGSYALVQFVAMGFLWSHQVQELEYEKALAEYNLNIELARSYESNNDLEEQLYLEKQASAFTQAKLNEIFAKYVALQFENEDLQTQLEKLTILLEQARWYGGYVEFENTKELMEWLYQNPVSEMKYRPNLWVCSDYARQLWIDALSEGYLMGLSRISDERRQKAFTIIGEDVWEIEAQSDGIQRVGRVYKIWD